MTVFLRNISIKGIKNLCHGVEVVFSKKEVKKFSELKDYNIKAIYGPNGSGKTALVHAFQVLRDITIDDGYLYDSDKTKCLYELMNKACKTIAIKADFFFAYANEKPEIYTYEIQIAHKNDVFEIAYEKFAKRTSEYAKEKVIVECVNGAFTKYELEESLKNEFINLLKKKSFMNVFIELLGRNTPDSDELSDKIQGSLEVVKPLIHFIFGTKVSLDDKDNHLAALTKTTEKLIAVLNFRQDNKELFRAADETGYSSKLLYEFELDEHEKEVKRKEKFIKLFKPSIKAINVHSKLVKKSSEEAMYVVNDFIDYGDYAIDVELESVGIKKLLNLYTSLKHVALGGILVIDELDSHINDVYLIKLIEYISEYSKGQLIFTTHNVSPMEVLKSKKNSIDFMTMSGKITSWTQIGNYSPSKLYKKGMVQGLPFNVEAESFLRVFSDE